MCGESNPSICSTFVCKNVRMYKVIFATAVFLFLFPQCTDSQTKRIRMQPFQVMFYNVENLFDTADDPVTNDNEYLPDGVRKWTPKRYYERLRQTAKVITAVGKWDMPALVGLCEVENDTVLTHLLHRTPLKEHRYRYCITRGNDPRGINNALLYRNERFKLLGQRSIRIRFTRKGKRSRDILHAWGRVVTGDTLDVLVCHFPSRSAGKKKTEPDRIDAALCVRRLCDSLYSVRRCTHIIVMGDFNDTPADESIAVMTHAAKPEHRLTNLFADKETLNFAGSHKFNGEWSQLDQMLVSLPWKARLKEGGTQIFAPSFLLTDDKRHNDKRPRRTYQGYTYKGGFSDHLPIVAEFFLSLPQ